MFTATVILKTVLNVPLRLNAQNVSLVILLIPMADVQFVTVFVLPAQVQKNVNNVFLRII